MNPSAFRDTVPNSSTSSVHNILLQMPTVKLTSAAASVIFYLRLCASAVEPSGKPRPKTKPIGFQ
jgi:hypothetical protein